MVTEEEVDILAAILTEVHWLRESGEPPARVHLPVRHEKLDDPGIASPASPEASADDRPVSRSWLAALLTSRTPRREPYLGGQLMKACVPAFAAVVALVALLPSPGLAGQSDQSEITFTNPAGYPSISDLVLAANGTFVIRTLRPSDAA